jgi:hypothetical protein
MTTDAETLRIGSAPPQAATGRAMGLAKRRVSLAHRLWSGNTGPVLVVVLAILALWYGAAAWMNWQGVADALQRAGEQRTAMEILAATMEQERPVLPAPHQIAVELKKTVIDTPITSRRSLVNHAWVTLSSTLLGFAMGALLGVVLAVSSCMCAPSSAASCPGSSPRRRSRSWPSPRSSSWCWAPSGSRGCSRRRSSRPISASFP